MLMAKVWGTFFKCGVSSRCWNLEWLETDMDELFYK